MGSRKTQNPTAPLVIGWPELLLVAGLALLLLQLFPGATHALLDLLDVRTWTWRVYAVAARYRIAFFVVVRASRE